MKKYYVIKDANSDKYYAGDYSKDTWQNEFYICEFFSSKKQARKLIFEKLDSGLYEIIKIYRKEP